MAAPDQSRTRTLLLGNVYLALAGAGSYTSDRGQDPRVDAVALTGNVARAAVAHLRELLAPMTGGGLGAVTAGLAEELVGDRAVVTAAVTALAGDVLDVLETNA